MPFTDEQGRVTRVAAYAVCVRAGDLLLVRLNEQTTAAGCWTLPGGGVDFGEHPEAAAIRELEEETGYVGKLTSLLQVDSFAANAGERFEFAFHAIRILYAVEIVGGMLRHEPDGNTTDEARWWSLEELRQSRHGELLVPTAQIGVQLATALAATQA